MPKVDIIRAWKDEEYRDSLSEEERAALPAHPAGVIELSDLELGHVAGGFDSEGLLTLGCCGSQWIPRSFCCLATGYIITYGCCPDDDAALM